MNTIADWIERNRAYLTGAVTDDKPRARQFYSRVLNRQLWRVHAPKMYDGCGTTLEGALRVFRANNQLT